MQNVPTLHYSAGEVIIQEGELSNSIFMIISGEVAVTKKSGGKPILLATQGKNTIFGEMTLIDGKRRSATITAKEETYCYKCDTISVINQLNQIDIELLRALKSLVAIVRQNNKEIILLQDPDKQESDLEIFDKNENDFEIMSLEKINSPETQANIKKIETPFIRSLFRILMKMALR